MENRQKIKSGFVILCFFALVMAAAAGIRYYDAQKDGTEEAQEQGPPEIRQEKGEVIMASGTTMAGMDRVTLDLETLEEQLIVEEVCVASGEEVETGGRIVRFTDESVEAVYRELSHAATEAELNYRQGLLDYRLALIEAEKERDTALLEAEYAQTDYDILLAEAQAETERLETELEEAKELYEEYYDGVYRNGYEILYELENRKELYETNEALYWTMLKKWNIDDLQVNHNGAGEGDRAGKGGQTEEQNGGGVSQIEALELLEDTYRANKADYEQAREDCARAVEQAQAGLQHAQAEYERLTLELEQARIDYEKKTAVGEVDYQTALAEGEAAEEACRTEQKKQQEQLQILADEQEEAQENLALFESCVTDGCLTAQSAGTVMAVTVSKGQALDQDDMILAYSDPERVTVSAYVDQSNIASVSVGESAVILSEEYGRLTGTVREVNPSANTGGRANVTYTAVIALDRTDVEIEPNRSVTVYFGMTQQEGKNVKGGMG